MPLIFVTGISGAGKSTVRIELVQRGYEAYDTDEDGIARFVNKMTGAVTGSVDASLRTIAFTQANDWMVDPERVRLLAQRAEDRFVFLCGSVANEIEVWDLFGKVILLSIDEATMRERVARRTASDFGKHAHELDLMLEWIKSIDDDYSRYGAIVIDGTRPLDEVLDKIIQVVGA
jgi:thymidylate kinase